MAFLAPQMQEDLQFASVTCTQRVFWWFKCCDESKGTCLSREYSTFIILANLSNLWVCSGPLSNSEWSIWNEPCYLACFGRYLVLCRSELRDCGRFLQGPHNWVQWSTTLGVCFAARKKHRGRGTEHQSQQKTTCQQISWIWDLGANKSSSVMIRLHIPSTGHRSNFWSFLYSVVYKPCTEWSIHAGLCSRRCLPENLIEGWVVKYQKRLVCIWQNLAFSFPTPLGMKVDLRLTFHINLFSWKISKSEVGLPSWPNSGTVSMSSHVNTNLGHVVPKFQYSAWHPGSATHHRLYQFSEPWVQIFVLTWWHSGGQRERVWVWRLWKQKGSCNPCALGRTGLVGFRVTFFCPISVV